VDNLQLAGIKYVAAQVLGANFQDLRRLGYGQQSRQLIRCVIHSLPLYPLALGAEDQPFPFSTALRGCFADFDHLSPPHNF
jgi:hypothetical protein